MAGGSGAPALPAAALRESSLRSASLRSAAGKAVGESGAIPLFFTLIPVLAPLSNYDQENCLINVGTEGRSPRGPINSRPRPTPQSAPVLGDQYSEAQPFIQFSHYNDATIGGDADPWN